MTEFKEYVEMNDKELKGKVEELKKQLIVDKFKSVTGQLEDTSVVKKTRKEIARVKTALNTKK